MKSNALQRAVLALTLVGGVVTPLAAQAQNSPWLVRVRAVNPGSVDRQITLA